MSTSPAGAGPLLRRQEAGWAPVRPRNRSRSPYPDKGVGRASRAGRGATALRQGPSGQRSVSLAGTSRAEGRPGLQRPAGPPGTQGEGPVQGHRVTAQGEGRRARELGVDAPLVFSLDLPEAPLTALRPGLSRRCRGRFTAGLGGREACSCGTGLPYPPPPFQGEKGEPGMVFSPDGRALTSAQKGAKVRGRLGPAGTLRPAWPGQRGLGAVETAQRGLSSERGSSCPCVGASAEGLWKLPQPGPLARPSVPLPPRWREGPRGPSEPAARISLGLAGPSFFSARQRSPHCRGAGGSWGPWPGPRLWCLTGPLGALPLGAGILALLPQEAAKHGWAWEWAPRGPVPWVPCPPALGRAGSGSGGCWGQACRGSPKAPRIVGGWAEGPQGRENSAGPAVCHS